MTGRFSIGIMHTIFQVGGTVFVEKRALNIIQKGTQAIQQMPEVLVVQCYLGQ